METGLGDWALESHPSSEAEKTKGPASEEEWGTPTVFQRESQSLKAGALADMPELSSLFSKKSTTAYDRFLSVPAYRS